MTYLLDTNVLSETRRRAANPRVLAWIGSVPAHELYVSVIVLGEICRGVESLRRRDPDTAARFDHWLELLGRVYADRIVPVTRQDALAWGRLTADRKVPLTDGLLAAQAIVRDWTFVTRNVKDFERTGARLLNPFEPAA